MLVCIDKFTTIFIMLLGEARFHILLFQLPDEPTRTMIDDAPSVPGTYLIFHECCQVSIGRVWVFHKKFFHSALFRGRKRTRRAKMAVLWFSGPSGRSKPFPFPHNTPRDFPFFFQRPEYQDDRTHQSTYRERRNPSC